MREEDTLAVLWLMGEHNAHVREFVVRYAAARALKRQMPVPQIRFALDAIDEEVARLKFRFYPDEIKTLCRLFALPSHVESAQGCRVPREETLCILLRRLTYPCRWKDLSLEFGRHWTVLCSVFSVAIDYLYRRYEKKILFDKEMIVRYAEASAEAIEGVTGIPNRVMGFIDGTLRAIARPTYFQRQAYNGWKRIHAIKFQSVTTANGLIVSLAGPIEGRRHDVALLRESGLRRNLRVLKREEMDFDGYIYGDPAYPLDDWLLRPFKKRKNKLEPDEETYNSQMSSARVTVEWMFNEIVSDWAFLDFKKNLKVFLSPVGSMYMIGALLTNCKTCFRGGNNTSEYFQLDPPTIDEYLELERNT